MAQRHSFLCAEKRKMTERCSHCVALEAENAVLKQQIVLLEREIKRLQRKLDIIRRYAEKVKEAAGAILCQRSGVPRGKWSFARGADRTADGVLRLFE
jgi:predicted RNase H-like nuclease (RuvC/YqgF family)